MLDDPAGAQDGDSLAHRQRLALVMGDQDRRGAERLQRRRDRLTHLLPEGRIERGKWLVEQHEPRCRCEGTRQRNPLLLTPRQLLWPTVGIGGRQADKIEHLGGSSLVSPPPKSKRDVAADREMRKQRALLRHVPDPPSFGRNVQAGGRNRHAIDRDHSSIGALEAGDQAQQSCLAAARRSEDGDQRAGLHMQRRTGEDGAITEILRHRTHIHDRHDELSPGPWLKAPTPKRRARNQFAPMESVMRTAA